MINPVAIITGSSRGIGRSIAHKLASMNFDVVLAAKSTKDSKDLPGTIYSVADEIKEKFNVNVLPVSTDMRIDNDINFLVKETINKFNRIDVLINNASALHWVPTVKTDIKKYDLIQQINTRGSFMLSRKVLPHMEKQNYGHIIMHSPPIDLNNIGGFTAYMISKYGMSMTALGIAQEYKDKNISANTIWPATMIESYATINHNLGNRTLWRKPDIISDSIELMLQENPKKFSGNMLIDENYLLSKNITDFTKYRCVEEVEPPKINKLWKNKNYLNNKLFSE